MARILLRYVLCSFLVLSLHASSAWADQIPLFDPSPEGIDIFNGLGDAYGSRYAEGIARYCGFQGIALGECVGPLQVLGQDSLDAASECGANAQEPSRSLENDLISHNTAGSSIGYWHQNWGKSPDEGEHLHMWSEEYRRGLAEKYASERTIQWIQEREHVSTTKESSQSSSASAGVEFGGGIGPVGIHGNAGREYTRGTSRGEERSGPTQAQIDSVHQKFFDEAYKRPEMTGAGPDILCHKGEEWCTAREPTRNPDFVKADEERAKAQENYDNDKQVCNDEKKPDPFAEPEPQRSEPPKKPADDDEEEKKKNGLHIDPDLSSGPSPLERCYMEELERKQKDGFHTTNDENDDGLTLKQRAERALKDGICLSDYYGETFCQHFNTMTFTGNLQPPKPEDTKSDDPFLLAHDRYLSGFNAHPGTIDFAEPSPVVHPPRSVELTQIDNPDNFIEKLLLTYGKDYSDGQDNIPDAFLNFGLSIQQWGLLEGALQQAIPGARGLNSHDITSIKIRMTGSDLRGFEWAFQLASFPYAKVNDVRLHLSNDQLGLLKAAIQQAPQGLKDNEAAHVELRLTADELRGFEAVLRSVQIEKQPTVVEIVSRRKDAEGHPPAGDNLGPKFQPLIEETSDQLSSLAILDKTMSLGLSTQQWTQFEAAIKQAVPSAVGLGDNDVTNVTMHMTGSELRQLESELRLAHISFAARNQVTVYVSKAQLDLLKAAIQQAPKGLKDNEAADITFSVTVKQLNEFSETTDRTRRDLWFKSIEDELSRKAKEEKTQMESERANLLPNADWRESGALLSIPSILLKP